MKRPVALLAVVAVLTGCASVPTAVAPDGARSSEVSQHEPPSQPLPADPGPRARRDLGVRPAARAARSRVAGELTIAAIGVRARVREVGFVGARLQIPASVAEVGLWSAGARPTDAVGSTVLVGHVSDNSDRPGVLSRLSRLRKGMAIRLRVHGRTFRFSTARLQQYPKAELPRKVFSQAGPHRLVLITCSRKVTYPNGAFHYTRNLVVTARPVR